MSWVAAAVAGAAVVGAAVSSDSSRKAANTQADAAKEANSTQLAMYNQTREDQAPWRAAGQQALGQLSSGVQPGGEFNRNFTLADFNRDPGYQFRMDQGQSALERSAAARGGLMNGGTLKALSRYGQDYASNEYNNAYNRFNNDQSARFNRLATVAGIGQTANNLTSTTGTQTASSIGNNTMSGAAAQAAGYVGSSNAWTNAANNGASMYMLSNMGSRQTAAQPSNYYSTDGTYPAGLA